MNPSRIINLTDSNFTEIICEHYDNNKNSDKKKLFLIDFWAEWCNPCKIFTSILEEIAKKFPDILLTIAKINVDNNPITTKKYNIKSIPTFLLIRDNKVLSTKIGVMSQQELEMLLKRYI